MFEQLSALISFRSKYELATKVNMLALAQLLKKNCIQQNSEIKYNLFS